MKPDGMNYCSLEPLSGREKYLVQEESFNLDIVLQLYQLREQRGLTQSELAEAVSTKQQSISRMESPGYDRHSLRMLRELAGHLHAFVDVVLVPEEKLDEYLEWRYQPALMENPPSVTTQHGYVIVRDPWQQAPVLSEYSTDWSEKIVEQTANYSAPIEGTVETSAA